MNRGDFPKDYRRGFMSVIKQALQKKGEDYYNRLYAHKVNKPFTFSVYFPELKGAIGDYLQLGSKANLKFSTNDYELLTYVYNGTLKNKEYQWNDYQFHLQKVWADFGRPVKQDQVTFKTLAPFLVNQKGNNLRYLTPEDNGFDDGFSHSVQELVNQFLKQDNADFEYNISRHKKMVVSHYNQSVTGNKGIIEVKADPEVLNLLYNVGIGVRRSQGFGMVELVK
jgi:CRISPR-associated endoribonuclease Cas6